jgi:hypothetical protein
MSGVEAKAPNVDPCVSRNRQRTCSPATVRDEIGVASSDRVPSGVRFGCVQPAAAAGAATRSAAATAARLRPPIGR